MEAPVPETVTTQNTHCNYCMVALQETDQQSTLLCGHKTHSTCFIRQMCIDSPRYLQCPACHLPITPASFLQEHLHLQAWNEHLQVSELQLLDGENAEGVLATIVQKFHEEPEFKDAVQKYYKHVKKCVTARNLFKKVVKQRKIVYKGQIAPLRDAIFDLRKETIKSIKQSPEYKLYLSRSRYLTGMGKLLFRKYQISMHRIKKAIVNMEGIRKWPNLGYFNDQPRYILRRAFRLR